uniref:Uncharacterized protein n=1 Tax=Setaria viridis TaxID=4556 RepID=A0A4U6V0F7_SETVI|nr:hypothetical protein SEVIR_4G233800v2 [Setaria viridis]
MAIQFLWALVLPTFYPPPPPPSRRSLGPARFPHRRRALVARAPQSREPPVTARRRDPGRRRPPRPPPPPVADSPAPPPRRAVLVVPRASLTLVARAPQSREPPATTRRRGPLTTVGPSGRAASRCDEPPRCDPARCRPREALLSAVAPHAAGLQAAPSRCCRRAPLPEKTKKHPENAFLEMLIFVDKIVEFIIFKC